MTDENVPDIQAILSDEATMQEVFRQARREAIRQHRMANQPMVVWQDGAIVWLQPDEFPDLDAPDAK